MISSCIDAFPSPLTVTRTTETTTFVNGVAQAVTEVDEFEVIPISVQPMAARERLLLPELIRDREALKAYTRCALYGVDVPGKVRADRITFKEENWVIHSVEDWSTHGGFWKVVLVKEND